MSLGQCPRLLSPVCGADGKSYDNACLAEFKSSVQCDGPCPCQGKDSSGHVQTFFQIVRSTPFRSFPSKEIILNNSFRSFCSRERPIVRQELRLTLVSVFLQTFFFCR